MHGSRNTRAQDDMAHDKYTRLLLRWQVQNLKLDTLKSVNHRKRIVIVHDVYSGTHFNHKRRPETDHLRRYAERFKRVHL